jgi:hypothetical protein
LIWGIALLCASVNADAIKLVSRWKSDSMLLYLHAQALVVGKHFAQQMLEAGPCTFAPLALQSDPLSKMPPSSRNRPAAHHCQPLKAVHQPCCPIYILCTLTFKIPPNYFHPLCLWLWDAHSLTDCRWRTMSGGFQLSTWTPWGRETVGPSKWPSFPTP